MKITPEHLQLTEEWVKTIFQADSSGHDWAHTDRVRKTALYLANYYCCPHIEKVELIALLHDVDDWKFQHSDALRVPPFLKELGFSDSEIHSLISEISAISFKGAGVENADLSDETKYVQDADRLDAIGAIGIARAFAYGGSRKRAIYIPDEKPFMANSFAEYQQNQSSTIMHFYEKLLLLKERMNTEKAREIAEKRHQFMERFLEQFFAEWNGEDL